METFGDGAAGQSVPAWPWHVTLFLYLGWVMETVPHSPATATHPLASSGAAPRCTVMFPVPDPALPRWSPHALCPTDCPLMSP